MAPRRRRLPLTALRTFEAAARLESFKAGAEELGLSPTTVSNQIRALETAIHCKLFVRKTRQVELTAAGRSLSQVVRQSFDAIAREIDTHVQGPRAAVSITVGPLFGARWLTPRLRRFRRDLPHIELSLQFGRRINAPADVTTAIVIDWGLGDWPGLISERLLGITYAPVLSPSLAAAHGGISKPADLAGLTLLHQFDRVEWAEWLALADATGLAFEDEIVIEDSNTVMQAAIDGQGAALGSFPFVQDDIDSGRLLKPIDIELSPTRCYFMLTRPSSRRRPEVAAVCDWLLREAAATEAAGRVT